MLKKLLTLSLMIAGSIYSLEEIPAYRYPAWGRTVPLVGAQPGIPANEMRAMPALGWEVAAVPAQRLATHAVPARPVYYKIGRRVNAFPAVRAQPENTYKMGEIAGEIPAVPAQKNLAEIARLQGWK